MCMTELLDASVFPAMTADFLDSLIEDSPAVHVIQRCNYTNTTYIIFSSTTNLIDTESSIGRYLQMPILSAIPSKVDELNAFSSVINSYRIQPSDHTSDLKS